MSRKKKIIIGLLLVLFLLLLVWLIWFLAQQKSVNKTVTTVNPASNETVVADQGLPLFPDVEPDITVAGLESLAFTFAERYGSYSTEGDYANLYDVMDLMTASLKTSTENFIASAQAATEYYGVSTRVLSTKVISSSDTAGTVEVSTQREESKGSPQASEVKYQKLLLSCLKENGVWKVNSAIWQ